MGLWDVGHVRTPSRVYPNNLAVRLGRIGRPLWLRRLTIDVSPFRPLNEPARRDHRQGQGHCFCVC
jgi:hypothetical protein